MAFTPVAGDADSLRCARHSIMDEDVLAAVRVAGHEIGGTADKRHESSVGCHRAEGTAAIRLRTARPDADATGQAGHGHSRAQLDAQSDDCKETISHRSGPSRRLFTPPRAEPRMHAV